MSGFRVCCIPCLTHSLFTDVCILRTTILRQSPTGSPQQSHGPAAHDTRSDKGHHRIDIANAPKQSTEQSENGTQIGQYVAEYMQIGRPAVDIAMVSMQQISTNKIRDTPHGSHHQCLPISNIDFGMQEAAEGLNKDEHRNEQQKYATGIGRKVENAVGIPTLIASTLQTPHKDVGSPTKPQHKHMTPHVGAFSQQGHGMSENANDKLTHHNDKGKHHYRRRATLTPRMLYFFLHGAKIENYREPAKWLLIKHSERHNHQHPIWATPPFLIVTVESVSVT